MVPLTVPIGRFMKSGPANTPRIMRHPELDPRIFQIQPQKQRKLASNGIKMFRIDADGYNTLSRLIIEERE